MYCTVLYYTILYVCLRTLERTLEDQGRWAQVDRMRELRHPEVSHRWLWHLDHATGSVLTEEDYVIGIQKRLGAAALTGYPDIPACHLCQRSLDPQLEHCETCARAEATRGHYACVRAVVDGLRAADPGLTTEPAGLTDTEDRPADILTTAATAGRSAALDLCVTSPNAAAAAGDAANAAFLRKRHRYRHILPQLERAGILYRPMVWTADGRPHPAATRTLRYAAERAVVKGGRATSVAAYLSRWRHEIQIAILRRRAAMTRAVLPRQGPGTWVSDGARQDDPPGVIPLEEESWPGLGRGQHTGVDILVHPARMGGA